MEGVFESGPTGGQSFFRRKRLPGRKLSRSSPSPLVSFHWFLRLLVLLRSFLRFLSRSLRFFFTSILVLNADIFGDPWALYLTRSSPLKKRDSPSKQGHTRDTTLHHAVGLRSPPLASALTRRNQYRVQSIDTYIRLRSALYQTRKRHVPRFRAECERLTLLVVGCLFRRSPSVRRRWPYWCFASVLFPSVPLVCTRWLPFNRHVFFSSLRFCGLHGLARSLGTQSTCPLNAVSMAATDFLFFLWPDSDPARMCSSVEQQHTLSRTK